MSEAPFTGGTWNEAEPAALAPLTAVERLRGGTRLVALALLTAVSLALFLLGHNLRRVLGRRVRFHFGAARLWSRGGLWLMGLAHVVHGRPLARGALVANHSSWLDIFALRATRLIYFVSKAEVADWPGIGFITRVTGTVFIERRRSHAKRQERILLERIAADQVLCFFPEGTSTDGQRVLEFKSSLFSAFFQEGPAEDVAVQPVSLCYHPAPGLPASFYGWWGAMGFEAHLWQVLCRSRGGRVEVVFHPAVSPADFADRKALAQHCQAAVAAGHAGGGG
ncbi:MAG: lysophospholipid acyltransferase family protein [Pseudomonadota bacterium]